MSVFHSYYFPLPLRIFGATLPFFALMAILKYESIIAPVILILFSFLFITSRYKIDINLKKKSVKEYLWIFGLKHGEEKSFSEMNNVILTKNTISKTYNSRGSTSTIKTDIYKLWLSIDDENVEMFQSENRGSVLKKAKELANKLSLKLMDKSI